MIKVPIHQDDSTILNSYEPNGIASKYVKQKLTELTGKIDKITIIRRGSNISLCNWWNKQQQQQIYKDIDLNNAID